MTDLATLKPTERTIEILHPSTGAPLGIRLTVMSIDDDRLKRVKRNITDEQLKLQARGKSFKADELERNAHQILFAASTGWTAYNPTGTDKDGGYDADATPTFNGKPWPDYNQRNFMEVIETLPWFADQVREAIDETKAFFGTSKAS